MAPRRRFALFYLILALTPVVGTLVAGEVMLRLLAPQELSGTWLTYGPRGLIVNKASTTARHQQGDTIVHYRFNHLHQRGAEPKADAQPVLVLGDSFTFGWMLEEPETYAGRLQARADERFGLGRFQLQNAATAGWGATDYLAYVETFGEQIMPFLVVVFVNLDDLDRALRRPLYGIAPNGALVAHDLSGGQNRLKMIMDRVPAYDWLLEHSHVVQLIRNSAVRGPRAVGLEPTPEPRSSAAPNPAMAAAELPIDGRVPLARALMERLRDWCDSRKVRLLVLTTGWFEANDRPWTNEMSVTLGPAFVNLAPRVIRLMGSDRPAYELRSDGHPNARGAAIIADAAWPALEKALSSGVD